MYLLQSEGNELEIDSLPEAAAAEPEAKSYFRQAVHWIVILSIGSILAWRIVTLGMAKYYATENPERALAWDPQHPLALRNQAARLLESAPEQAEQLLQESIWQNPSDARAYAMLALLRERAGKVDAARQLMELASALGPRQWSVQLEIAAFWLRQRRLELAVQSWDTALQMRSALSKQIFPALLRIAEYPTLRQALLPVARATPVWWPNFFIYAATNATQLETLRALYDIEREVSPTMLERSAFVSRLQKEGYWIEAYFIWLNGLDEGALQGLGNIFNGQFEWPLSNESFGWHFSQPRGVEIGTASTYGMEGNSALRIAFSGQRVRFQHLSQPLLLTPGSYQMEGNVRLDNLETAQGLQWAVYCLAPGQQQLAVSERFVGASLWHQFNFSLEVPKKDCAVQLLRLELLGRAPADFEARGIAWFDDLAIERVKKESE
ncbi:MAG: tetratricopeptide repeat protein [Candidatus Nitrosoglobus sp.]